MSPRSVLMAAGIGAGLFETASAPFLDMAAGKVMAAVFAALFLGASWLLRTRTTGPSVVLLLLFALELSFLPVYDRVSVIDWVLQGGFGVLALIGCAAAVGVLVGRRRASAEAPAQGVRSRT